PPPPPPFFKTKNGKTYFIQSFVGLVFFFILIWFWVFLMAGGWRLFRRFGGVLMVFYVRRSRKSRKYNA
ncbi:hypothetical protein, partial [Enterobacter asburiae]